MKKLPLFFSVIGIFGLLVLIIPSKRNNFSPIPNNKDFLGDVKADLIIEPDQEGKFTMKPAWYRYFNLHQLKTKVNKQKSGLQFIYAKEQKQKNFINFKLANRSSEQMQIRTQNGSLIMIQEAKNEKGKWQPIEYWNYDWGTGSVFEQLKLEPNHAVIVSAPRYKGVFETEFRFKLKVGNAKDNDDVIYSSTFKGSISPSQFKINPKSQDKTISYLEEKP